MSEYAPSIKEAIRSRAMNDDARKDFSMASSQDMFAASREAQFMSFLAYEKRATAKQCDAKAHGK